MMEIFIPKIRIPINSKKDVDKYRILYNQKKDIYLSVYEYDGDIHISNVIVDKIFLDFDYDDDMLFFYNVRKVAQFLADSNYKFSIRFSGRGFHLFIYLDTSIPLKNPKYAIRQWVKSMHINTNTDSDSAVVGDLRRVSRMLASMNLKTHLYCIPLKYSELMNYTYHRICEMAKELHTESYDDIYYDGDKLLDISDYDTTTINKSQTIKDNIDISNITITNKYPPCIEQMLKNQELGYYERGQLIVFLRDQGYSFYEILVVLKSILSPDKYYHSIEEEKQPEYLYYAREDILFSSCDTQKNNGICPFDGYCGGPNLYL